MPKQKMAKGDEVLIRGKIVWFDDSGLVRVKIPGYQYPITVDPEEVVEVIKAAPASKKPRRKPPQNEPT